MSVYYRPLFLCPYVTSPKIYTNEQKRSDRVGGNVEFPFKVPTPTCPPPHPCSLKPWTSVDRWTAVYHTTVRMICMQYQVNGNIIFSSNNRIGFLSDRVESLITRIIIFELTFWGPGSRVMCFAKYNNTTLYNVLYSVNTQQYISNLILYIHSGLIMATCHLPANREYF